MTHSIELPGVPGETLAVDLIGVGHHGLATGTTLALSGGGSVTVEPVTSGECRLFRSPYAPGDTRPQAARDADAADGRVYHDYDVLNWRFDYLGGLVGIDTTYHAGDPSSAWLLVDGLGAVWLCTSRVVNTTARTLTLRWQSFGLITDSPPADVTVVLTFPGTDPILQALVDVTSDGRRSLWRLYPEPSLVQGEVKQVFYEITLSVPAGPDSISIQSIAPVPHGGHYWDGTGLAESESVGSGWSVHTTPGLDPECLIDHETGQVGTTVPGSELDTWEFVVTFDESALYHTHFLIAESAWYDGNDVAHVDGRLLTYDASSLVHKRSEQSRNITYATFCNGGRFADGSLDGCTVTEFTHDQHITLTESCTVDGVTVAGATWTVQLDNISDRTLIHHTYTHTDPCGHIDTHTGTWSESSTLAACAGAAWTMIPGSEAWYTQTSTTTPIAPNDISELTTRWAFPHNRIWLAWMTNSSARVYQLITTGDLWYDPAIDLAGTTRRTRLARQIAGKNPAGQPDRSKVIAAGVLVTIPDLPAGTTPHLSVHPLTGQLGHSVAEAVCWC